MSKKPVVFISYSHQDDPVRPREGEVQWFSYVKSHLDPLFESGLIEIWHDRRIEGGADWEAEILKRLADCDVCLLLVSRHSLISQFILKVEIKTMLERRKTEGAHIYPLLVTPTSLAGADWLKRMNIRPRDLSALSGLNPHDRDQTMVELVEEIAEIAARVAEQRKQAPAPHTDASRAEMAPPSVSSVEADEIVRCIDQHEPRPELFGRDEEIETIVAALLAGQPTIIAGGPGMGKTAVATAALYDPRIVARFGKRRVFASLEAESEPRAILGRLGSVLKALEGLSG